MTRRRHPAGIRTNRRHFVGGATLGLGVNELGDVGELGRLEVRAGDRRQRQDQGIGRHGRLPPERLFTLPGTMR